VSRPPIPRLTAEERIDIRKRAVREWARQLGDRSLDSRPSLPHTILRHEIAAIRDRWWEAGFARVWDQEEAPPSKPPPTREEKNALIIAAQEELRKADGTELKPGYRRVYKYLQHKRSDLNITRERVRDVLGPGDPGKRSTDN
jgi:hypothetical protein